VLEKSTLGNRIPVRTRDLVAVEVLVACTDIDCSAISFPLPAKSERQPENPSGHSDFYRPRAG